jgi:hypothetical protein
MRDYHMSETTALQYPLIRAFALLAFRAINNGVCEMQIDGLGYLAQESERLASDPTTA